MHKFFKIRIPKKIYKISTRKKRQIEDDKMFARQMQEIADKSAAKSMNKKLNNNSTRKKKQIEDDEFFARQMQEIADKSAAKSMNKKLNNNSKKKEIIANRLNNYDNRVPKSLIKDMFNKERNVEKLIKDLKVMGFLRPEAAAAAATPKTSYLVNRLNRGLGKSRKKLKKNRKK